MSEKFKDRKEQRKVTETMNALILPMLPYLNSETAIRVRQGLYILSTVEIEEKEQKILKKYMEVSNADNATNGDVIKAIFPNVKWFFNEYGEIFTDHKTFNSKRIAINTKWWDAPYKEVSDGDSN